MGSPTDNPNNTCHECGENFTHRWSTSNGKALGPDSLARHQRETGHVQHDPASWRDDSIKGEVSGRLTASYRFRHGDGDISAQCRCGRSLLVPAGSWGAVDHCGSDYEIIEADGVRQFAVVDRDEVAQWLVINVPAPVGADEVADVLIRSGVSARLDVNRDAFAPFRVAPVDELRPGMLGLRRILAAEPKQIRTATRWICSSRIAWPGMVRHTRCMVPGFRADDRRFHRSTVNYDALGQKGRHRFIADNPECVLCPAASEVVDHDHATGLVRGALCQNCNGRLGVVENLCDPSVPATSRTDPDFARRLWAGHGDWLTRAMEFAHHDDVVFHEVYGFAL